MSSPSSSANVKLGVRRVQAGENGYGQVVSDIASASYCADYRPENRL